MISNPLFGRHDRAIQLLASLVLALAWISPAGADPLDRRQLPGGAAWFVHLDVDAAKASTLGQGVRDGWLKQPDVAKAIDKARTTTGVDLTREIQSITLYGLSFSPDQTVVIVRGKINREHLESVIKELSGYHRETIGGHDIRYWSERHADGGNSAATKAGAFFGTDTIVISPTVATLVTALDVLEGKAAALDDASPLAIAIPPGTIVVAAVTGLADAKAITIQSPILRKCESGWVLAGEQNGKVFLHGRVLTRAAETASQMKTLIEGVKAMAQLQGNPNLEPLFKPLEVVVEGNAVDVQWGFSSRELVKIIQQAQDAKGLAAPSTSSGQAPQPGKDP